MIIIEALSPTSGDCVMSNDYLDAQADIVPRGLMEVVTDAPETSRDDDVISDQTNTARAVDANDVGVKGSDEDDDDEETYGPAQIEALLSKCKADSNTKPGISYIALISLAIQSSTQCKMLLAEIYQWVQENIAYYRVRDKSWRNSIRHNLSLNECFIKAGRSDNGKGNFWTIHPACADNFARCDFRRRRARRLVRKYDHGDFEKLSEILFSNSLYSSDLAASDTYVPMTVTRASGHALVNMFGPEAILTREEMRSAGYSPDSGSGRYNSYVDDHIYNQSPTTMTNQIWSITKIGTTDSSGYMNTESSLQTYPVNPQSSAAYHGTECQENATGNYYQTTGMNYNFV